YEWAGTSGNSNSVPFVGWGSFGPYGNSLQPAWSALAAAIVPGGTTESPLYFNLPGWGTLAIMARVRKHTMPLDITYALGNLVDVTIQFSASDPRIYATPTQNPSIGLPTPGAGFAFPLSFGISFGGGGAIGNLTVANAGNIETRPLLVVTGPC